MPASTEMIFKVFGALKKEKNILSRTIIGDMNGFPKNNGTPMVHSISKKETSVRFIS